MTSEAIEEAFQRHPRPQVPTKAALLKKALQNDKRLSSPSKEIRGSPWKTLNRQGSLTEGEHVWIVCIQQGQLVMVKEMSLKAGRKELEVLTKLSDHLHVSTIKQAFETETSLYFQLEYARCSLAGVLTYHMQLEEAHIRVLASSVRFAIWNPTKLTPNRDLECLGAVILECMNGRTNEKLKDPVEVRRLRKSNKIFGLENGEQWSGFKLLVDFVDSMFNEGVPAIAKLEKPVGAPLNSKDEDWDSMFHLDPTISPFLPQPNSEHASNAALDLSCNLDYFNNQPLLPAVNYLPQPNYYPEPTLPYKLVSADHGAVQGDLMSSIREDLDRVIRSVWKLRRDTDTKVQNLETEIKQASKVAGNLRKDVDAIEEWMNKITAFLNAARAPSELPCDAEDSMARGTEEK
ncbi:uncharacterized protein K460DRAFT_348226 [Cucurbitaria berberidis CBS 394.84]|uniref:Uncharacterized protein n=1 Tax=Cucurbitaria berberidis CBS 394.84 TaxID=1168544 RepID=A0A9P4L3A7_9PLEO|nr:uncharacterized protein K460DRAFT_348226 [Cucurbitaria berberidis CBS 394.84]KAF1840097.1 hypothetical protein K460DRAFT_348226 [Cucurbitaria berberidis CBS 394.84]